VPIARIDEAVPELPASDLPDFYAERAGLHAATSMPIAALGERGAERSCGLPR